MSDTIHEEIANYIQDLFFKETPHDFFYAIADWHLAEIEKAKQEARVEVAKKALSVFLEVNDCENGLCLCNEIDEFRKIIQKKVGKK